MRTSALSSIVAIFGYVLRIGVPLIGLVIIALRVQGRARALGIAATSLVLLEGVLQIVYTLTVTSLVRSTGYYVISLFGLALTLIGVLAIGLFVAAVCVGRPPKPPAGPPSPGPYGSFSPPPTQS